MLTRVVRDDYADNFVNIVLCVVIRLMLYKQDIIDSVNHSICCGGDIMCADGVRGDMLGAFVLPFLLLYIIQVSPF